MDLYNPDITYLAKTNFRGTDQIFGVKRKDRRQHMYVVGKSGTGKSVLLENMIIQNIRNGEGLCVIDPHGELVEKIITSIPKERAEDVIYFNPSDTDFSIGFNVLQVDDPKYKHLIASGLMGIFTKIWANTWSARMEYILNNCILALLDTPGSTLMGIPRLLVDKDYRQYVISNLKDPVVKAFWIHEFEAWRDQFRTEAVQPIQNKVGQFLSSNIVRNIVGQQKSTVNIFDMMNTKKIFLVNLSKGRVGEDNSALLGAMLITKIQLAAMERVRIPEVDRKDFYLYVDEFQNFVTDSFASILSEARKYRLNLIIAHQYIAQLETANGSAVKDAVFGNVGTMITFRVGAEDGAALEGEFEPEFTTEDFVNLPNYHIYLKLMVDGVTSRPFSAKTLPPIPVNESPEMMAHIIETSRRLYAKPRDQIETDIDRWSSSVPGAQDDETSVGKFKAECVGCKKQIYVPFEPDPSRPIYCKDCMLKIKTGDMKAVEGFRLPKNKNEVVVSYDALSNLGIEYAPSAPKRVSFTPPRTETPRNSTSAPQASTPGASYSRPSTFAPRPQTGGVQGGSRTPSPAFTRPPAPSFTSEKNNLKDIITSAVAEVKKTFSPPVQPRPVSERRPLVPNPQVRNTTVAPSLSLKNLVTTQTRKHTPPGITEDTKTAKPASMNSLKDAIKNAMEKQTVAKEPPVQPPAPVSVTEPVYTQTLKEKVVEPIKDNVPPENRSENTPAVSDSPVVSSNQNQVPPEAFSKVFE